MYSSGFLETSEMSSTNTSPTLRRSPRSPIVRKEQYIDIPPHPENRSLRSGSIPQNSRHNLTSFPEQSPRSQSRPGSLNVTRRSSRSGSRQANASGGVVGLPGAGTSSLSTGFDDLLDLSIFQQPTDFFGDYWNLEYFGTIDQSTTAFDANGFQDTTGSMPFFNQDFQYAQGLDLAPINDVEHNQVTQNLLDSMPPAFELDPNVDYLDIWNNTGLSAIPGGNSSFSDMSQVFQQPKYPDPLDSLYSTGPYYNPLPQQYTGYVPIPADPLLSQVRVLEPDYTSDRNTSRRFSNKEGNAPTVPKRKRAQQPDTDSEDDTPLVKRRRQTQTEVTQRKPAQSASSRNDSVVSESSSLGRPVQIGIVRAGQKPKKHEEKSWVRINNSTKGQTTRTARINQFAEKGPWYTCKPLPIGDWETTKFKFEYAHHFGMDQFKRHTMSARQIHEYVTEYPGNNLRIWIQVTPGDSARRYASASHSHCLFEQCPNRRWANKGTIEVGTYRVAFDEKYKAYGKGVSDPFDCAGYAHLYCVERFLDFAGICEIADVKVDDRSGLKKEPNASAAAFTFLNPKHHYEKLVAEKFVRAAQAGALHRTPEFFNYPIHAEYSKGAAKPHEHTLVFALYRTNLDHRTRSQLKQFVFRNIMPGAFQIHQGDQEVVNIDKMVMILPAYKKAVEYRKKKSFNFSDYYDQFFPEVNIRIAKCRALKAQLQAEDAAGSAPKRGGSKKRAIIEVEDDDDDEPDTDARLDDNDSDDDFEERPQPVQGSRSSPRKRQRINYSDPQDTPQAHDVYAQIPQLLPQYDNLEPQHQSQFIESPQPNTHPHTPSGRRITASDLFRNPNDGHRQWDIDALPPVDDLPPVTQEELDRILGRRQSSTTSIGPYASIMKPQRSPRSPQATRHTNRSASFNAQPVSSSKEFGANDPPSRVARAVYEQQRQERRSQRIASKLSPTTVSSTLGRVGRRRGGSPLL